jgi:hypothetical protein
MHDVAISLGLDAREFDARLAALESKIQSSSKNMSKSFAGVGGGIGGALGGFLTVGALAGAVKGIVDYGAQIQDLSNRFGVSTDALQHFGNEAEKNGTSLESVAMGFNKLAIARSRAMEGQGKLIDSFNHLGISMADVQKLSPEQLMMKIGASSMNAADMVELLGRSSLELKPLLEGLASGAIKVGDAIDKQMIAKLKHADDATKTFYQNLLIYGVRAAEKTGGALDVVQKKLQGVHTGMMALFRGDFKNVFAGKQFTGFGGHSDLTPISLAEHEAAAAGKSSLKTYSPMFSTSAEELKAKKLRDADDAVTLNQIRENQKLTLSELAGREDSIFHGKYIGDDISKAKEALREKDVVNDLVFQGHDDQAKQHMDRFNQLTSGIGSLKGNDKGMEGLVQQILKSAETIAENSKEKFANK